MRKVILTATLVGLLAVPVFGQFRGGMMGGAGDGTALLAVPDVQKELNLSEEQKKSITSANDNLRKAFQAAIQDMDREAMQKAMQERTKTMTKIKEGLTSEQSKRLGQLEIQAAVKMTSPMIFKNANVVKGLKLTEKQQEMVGDYEKDLKEVMEDAKGDREKMRSSMEKARSMGKETFTKVTKSFSEAQKTSWKEMQGDEFKGQLSPFAGGFGGGRPGKEKGKKKKDDF